MVDPQQHATIIAKSDSGASNHYWRNEDTTVLINVKRPGMEQHSNCQKMRRGVRQEQETPLYQAF